MSEVPMYWGSIQPSVLGLGTENADSFGFRVSGPEIGMSRARFVQIFGFRVSG